MKNFIMIFILVLLSGCSILGGEDVPEYFWANVQFHNIANPENINYNTFSVTATIWANEGGIQEKSKIWISFKSEIGAGLFFNLPSPIRIVAVRLKRIDGNIYDFIAFRDPSVIEFEANINGNNKNDISTLPTEELFPGTRNTLR